MYLRLYPPIMVYFIPTVSKWYITRSPNLSYKSYLIFGGYIRFFVPIVFSEIPWNPTKVAISGPRGHFEPGRRQEPLAIRWLKWTNSMVYGRYILYL